MAARHRRSGCAIFFAGNTDLLSLTMPFQKNSHQIGCITGAQLKKKKFNQQTVIERDALVLFIADPSPKTFVGVSYYMHGRYVLYDQECLRRNLLPRIRGVFYDHGFSLVDASTVLKLVIGFSQKRSMKFKGPLDFSPLQFMGDLADSPVEYSGPFMLQDRSMVNDLIDVIFSMQESVARNQNAVPVTTRIISAAFSVESRYRKVVIMYTANSADDCLRVTIEGERGEPNTFTFEHTVTWIQNRYSNSSSLAAAND